jgi:2-C-methyl-D-erythritol 4-phosphate cytidylyltransferase/2-C-methyl-D-erythritol 2,4-cyclodiphosphate synthase
MRNEHMTIAALIVAAGRGTRAGAGQPKQYRDLGGEPVLRHTLRAFAEHPAVTHVLAVIHPDDRQAYDIAAAALPKLVVPCAGGATRQDSVRLGLQALEGFNPDSVLIHDGARPFVSNELISRVIENLSQHAGALPALPVTDTLRYAPENLAGDIVSRDGLWRAQTPQGFRFASILEAHQRMSHNEMTDDVAVATASGLDVTMVEGEEENFKLTSLSDLERASRMLNVMSETRTGMGYDVHRFGDGDHVMLGGIAIPHDFGLVGHSDADVGLHAVTDAILGALGAGDIGVHFPPGNPQWKGASSELFLQHAAKLANAAQARISHVDLTFICERPKIGPHAQAMRNRISEILHIEEGRVSIKATTTEGLGFTGRGEGIAAQAIATLAFKKRF